jgi:hypothetical protein
MTAKTVALCLVRFICQHGCPSVIVTDQGSQFESLLFSELCLTFGIEKRRTTPYHPQSNAKIERFHRTLKSILASVVSDSQTDWDVALYPALLAYRSSVQESCGFSPFELARGYPARIPSDLVAQSPSTDRDLPSGQFTREIRSNLRKVHEEARQSYARAQNFQKIEYDKTVKGHPFQIGDKVLLRIMQHRRGITPKLAPKYQGPYTVTQLRLPNYTLRRPNSRTTFLAHHNRLRPFSQRHVPRPSDT